MGTYGMIFARMMLFILLMAMSTFSRVQRSLKIRIQVIHFYISCLAKKFDKYAGLIGLNWKGEFAYSL